MEFEVLICGSDVNAYYMARCMHEAYNRNAYMLIKDKLAYTTYSKIINHIYNDKIWDEDEFVKAVNDFASSHSKKKILVISSNETYERFLVGNADRFVDNIVFNYPSEEIIDTLINKETFYKTYEDSVLSFPKTYYLSGSETSIPVDLTYPVIVKPADVISYNHVDFPGKKKIFKLEDQSQLKECLELIKNSDYNETIIVQEYIPGDDSHLFDSVVYCDSNGEVRLVSMAQIGLQEHNPNMVGNAAMLINGFNSFNADTDVIVKQIREFMTSINYKGFAEFDLKYDERDCKFKVLEINARQGRCSYYITQCGYNLVKILVDDLLYNNSIDYTFVNSKVMLSFVNKKIIKKYVKNPVVKSEALKLYSKSVNPIKYKKDRSFYRYLLYIKRDRNYSVSFKNYKWD